MDWTIKEYNDANHPPVPKLSNEEYMKVKSGDRVNLSAEGSSDPDGDNLSYKWFVYYEPGTYARGTARTADVLKINDADMANAWLIAPKKGKLGTIHIILAVTDHGTPALTRYKRVIIDVSAD
jgi:hypothetical protein